MTTTTNNLIDQVGGIEKAKAIVEGAPDNTQVIIPCSDGVMYFSKRVDGKWFRYSDGYQKWLEYFGSCDPMDLAFNLNDLRTAIAQHDKKWVEKRFSIKKWHPIPEHHMCTDRQSDQEFKVGGSIVKINNGGYSRFETEVHQVELVESERVKVFSQDKSHSYWVRLELFRHATPAEIKAGRRLDHSENVTDHVTDIRNHISPNTKVVEL